MSYTHAEEIANSITHGVGVLFSVAALSVLMVLAGLFGHGLHIASYLIYGLSLILLYSSSTLYHALPSPKAKRFFKVCDHSAIYLLIAGTYTPFLLINLGGEFGRNFCVVIWAIALTGVVFKLFFTGRFKRLSTFLYVVMGWLVLVALKPLMLAIPQASLVWLFAGGLAYTLGALIYLMLKRPYSHAVWHMFVLAGSVFQFIAVIYAGQFSH